MPKGAGAGSLNSPVPHRGKKFGSSRLEGAPVCLSLLVLLLQDRKIRALEEMVQTLQEHQGKRLSRWAGQPSWGTSPGPVAPGHQGSRSGKMSPVVGPGQRSPESDRDTPGQCRPPR